MISICHGPSALTAAAVAGPWYPPSANMRFDEGEHLAHGLQDKEATVAVLYVGWMNNQIEHQAERIDKDVTLLAFDFLAGVVARWVNLRPPFSAPLTLWLSMMAAVGLASRSVRSRTAV